uniref:DNA repair protein Rad51 homolog (inferred by orthology to a D. melanogaster protein) n=1 Tax=Strongyloides venezuelensis TaxID=75913 RepID=A0A0K0FUM2_STRVS
MATRHSHRPKRAAAVEAEILISEGADEVVEKESNVMEEEDELDVGYQKIEILEKYGIDTKDIQRLKGYGFFTVESLLYVTKKALVNLDQFSEDKVNKILRQAKKLVSNVSFTSASKILEQRENLIKIRTGSRAMDRLFGGGIETGSITEIFGEAGTGKTQLCHMLAVNCQLPADEGGGEGKCMWLDTEGSFRSERIFSINNITYARVYNSEHQVEILGEAAALMSTSKYSLLIVDSIMALFRNDYRGRGELADRQCMLGKFLRHLLRLADEFGVAIVMTNQVTATVDGSVQMGAPEKTPVGGHILAHASTTRACFEKGKKGKRICKLYASPALPEGECIFKVGDGGIEDYEKS